MTERKRVIHLARVIGDTAAMERVLAAAGSIPASSIRAWEEWHRAGMVKAEVPEEDVEASLRAMREAYSRRLALITIDIHRASQAEEAAA